MGRIGTPAVGRESTRFIIGWRFHILGRHAVTASATPVLTSSMHGVCWHGNSPPRAAEKLSVSFFPLRYGRGNPNMV